MDKLLVIELDGIDDIIQKCYSSGWEPIFIESQNYKKWLPVEIKKRDVQIIEKKSLNFLDIMDLAAKYDVQSILPISLLEPDCERDALVKDYINVSGQDYRILANSISTVEMTYDKWLTKELCKKINLPIIPARLVEKNEDLNEIAKSFGLPIIVKQRKNFTGQGLRIIKDNDSLQSFIKKYESKNLIVEPFIEGYEISLEVISWKGKKVFQPLVYKGKTRLDIYEHPAYRPRISPWLQGSQLEKEIIEIASKVSDALNLQGASEFEFVVHNNKPLLLEINPRISGVTRLCKSSGGANVYELLAQIAINDELSTNQTIRDRYAIQLPLTILPEGDLLNEFKQHQNIHYIKPITWMPILPIKSNIIISNDSPDKLYKDVLSFEKYTNKNYLNEAKSIINQSI